MYFMRSQRYTYSPVEWFKYYVEMIKINGNKLKLDFSMHNKGNYGGQKVKVPGKCDSR